MSNEMTLFEGGVPSYIKGIEGDETTKALMGGGSTAKRISIRGGIFRMVVGGKEVAKNEARTMDVVIVKAAEHVARQYYAGTYNPDSAGEAPDCWSSDGRKPDAGVEKPQGASCATCPQNIAGSGQGKSRACRFQQRLAVVMAGDLEGDVYQLALPATSIFGDAQGTKMPLHAYGRYLAGHGIPVTAVVTEMKFDTDVETPKLTFRPKRPLDEAEYNTCKAQGGTPEALSAVSIVVAKRDGTADTRKAEAPQPAKGSAQEEGASAAPTVRQTKSSPTAPQAATTVEDVLSSWDTDDAD